MTTKKTTSIILDPDCPAVIYNFTQICFNRPEWRASHLRSCPRCEAYVRYQEARYRSYPHSQGDTPYTSSLEILDPSDVQDAAMGYLQPGPAPDATVWIWHPTEGPSNGFRIDESTYTVAEISNEDFLYMIAVTSDGWFSVDQLPPSHSGITVGAPKWERFYNRSELDELRAQAAERF